MFNFCTVVCIIISFVIVKILSTHYLGMIFITREWIALLKSKFNFQIEDWNLPTVCYLHVNIRLMSIINQSAFLIWNKATIVTLQYSIWKWNPDSNNPIRSRIMKYFDYHFNIHVSFFKSFNNPSFNSIEKVSICTCCIL